MKALYPYHINFLSSDGMLVAAPARPVIEGMLGNFAISPNVIDRADVLVTTHFRDDVARDIITTEEFTEVLQIVLDKLECDVKLARPPRQIRIRRCRWRSPV